MLKTLSPKLPKGLHAYNRSRKAASFFNFSKRAGPDVRYYRPVVCLEEVHRCPTKSLDIPDVASLVDIDVLVTVWVHVGTNMFVAWYGMEWYGIVR